ncbi:MAG: hypothetical protein NTV12_03970, partial [Verrucomicrobia bacterium]|nr:hypothetical protein [Verrucomicrobiota bacterium]
MNSLLKRILESFLQCAIFLGICARIVGAEPVLIIIHVTDPSAVVIEGTGKAALKNDLSGV